MAKGANKTSEKAGKRLAKKTALAKITKQHRRGQTDPLLGPAWHAWLEHVRNQWPTWLYVALSMAHLPLLPHHRDHAPHRRELRPREEVRDD